MVTIERALQEVRDGRADGSILTEETRNLAKAEISAIRKYTRSDFDEAAIYTFPCLAIDTTPTRNGVIYSKESQKATCKKWIGIPFLFNAEAQGAGIFANGQDHTVQAASQYARIYKAQLVETGGGNVGTLVWVYTFPDISPSVREFVNKVDTGILREVSIHVMAKNGVVCSICDKQFGEDDHTHMPGEKYGKQTCYMKTVGELDPIELSSVACPGSVVAHIMDNSEVSDYKLLSLREALRGSHSSIEAHMSETVTEDENTPLAESTPVVITEACDDDKEGKEKKAKKGDDPDDSENKEDEDESGAANNTGKKAAKQSFSLFENKEACPVCNRTEAAPENAEITDEVKDKVLAEYRSDVESRILKITEAAKVAVDKADERAVIAEQTSADASALLEFFADETVELAIGKGLKESTERDAYKEELRSIGFRGIKALREAYQNAPSKTEDARRRLEESAKANFQRADSTRTDSKTNNGAVGGFTAPIAPAPTRR